MLAEAGRMTVGLRLLDINLLVLSILLNLLQLKFWRLNVIKEGGETDTNKVYVQLRQLVDKKIRKNTYT